MGQFQYTAHAMDDGETYTSTCYADNENALRSELRRIGFNVDSVKPQKTSQIFGQRKKIKLIDLVNMSRRFSVMHAAGLPLMDCLSSLAQENESKNLSDTLQDITREIEQGSNVAEAFSKYPKVFSTFFVNLLRAGETAGKFDYVLAQLAVYMEKEYDLRRKIRQAFSYPLLVLIMIFLVVTMIMIVVVPAFSKVYLRIGVPLPGPTIALILISNNAIYIFPTIFILAAGLWVLRKKFLAIPAVKTRLDRWKLSITMVGTVYHKVILLKFIRTLSIMIAAGQQVSDALDIAKDVADNVVVSDATSMIQRNIKHGGTIADAVKLHSFFPPAVVHTISVGEMAGKLDEILDKFAIGIEQEVDDGIRKIVTKIEPLLMVVLSLVVGFILLAIYLPTFDLVKMIHQ
jgi:type IV pilus assembly protein PilC